MQGNAEQVQKLVFTKKIIKDDSLEDNILSEKISKKIHAAGNCELHEIQQRTNKVQCQRCCSYIESGFQFKYVHAEESWTCQKKCFPASDKNWATHLQMLTWHSKEREEPGMVFSRGKSIITLPNSLWERSTKRESTRRFFYRFQNFEVFHASQLQHNWTKEWCEYFDYVRYHAQWFFRKIERYAALYHFRYDPKQVEKGLIKSRPIVSMNKVVGQTQESKRRQLSRGSGLREARLANMALTQYEMVLRGEPNLRIKFHTMASPKINRRACLGKPKSIHSWWPVESNLVDHGLVEDIKMDVEWRKSEDFFWLRNSHPRSGNYCVCYGECTHTPCLTHIFFCTFSLRDVQIRTPMAQGVCSVYVISLHIALSILMFHPPSLLFPHGHFDTTIPSAPSSSSFTRQKTRVKRTSARAPGSLATWPIPRT